MWNHLFRDIVLKQIVWHQDSCARPQVCLDTEFFQLATLLDCGLDKPKKPCGEDSKMCKINWLQLIFQSDSVGFQMISVWFSEIKITWIKWVKWVKWQVCLWRPDCHVDLREQNGQFQVWMSMSQLRCHNGADIKLRWRHQSPYHSLRSLCFRSSHCSWWPGPCHPRGQCLQCPKMFDKQSSYPDID